MKADTGLPRLVFGLALLAVAVSTFFFFFETINLPSGMDWFFFKPTTVCDKIMCHVKKIVDQQLPGREKNSAFNLK